MASSGSPAAESRRGNYLRATLRVLRNKYCFVYFSGQLVSMSGSWMQSVAQAWLVYRLSHSAYWLGLTTFCMQLPAFLFAPLAGVVADRLERRKILVAVQAVGAIQALFLAALVYLGVVQLWHILVLAFVLGVTTSFDATTRHAFAVDLVGKTDLSSAISLNSVMVNGSRILGPAAAGVFIGILGEAGCFTLNGLSYIPVLVGLIWMGGMPQMHARAQRGQSPSTVLGHMREGVRYIGRSPIIFRILVLSTFVCLVAVPFGTLLPVFAKGVLHGGASTLGWLTGMMGLGAIFGALSINADRDTVKLRRRLIRNVLGWGAGLILLGVSSAYWLTLASLLIIGFFMMNMFTSMNIGIQHMVEDHMRARVLSVYTMTFLGTGPIGSLAVGWLSDRFSAQGVVAGAGILTVAIGASLIGRSVVRQRLQLANA